MEPSESYAINNIFAPRDCFERNTNYNGGDIGFWEGLLKIKECHDKCKITRGCRFFTYVSDKYYIPYRRYKCFLKGSKGSSGYLANVHSGPLYCR